MSETKSVKPVTQKRLMNIALYYLGRYESSADNLRRLLKRRVAKAAMKGADVPDESAEWIESVVAEMKRAGYVNDSRFAAMTVEKYRKAGKSERFIRQKLAQAGIDPDGQGAALSTGDSAENGDSDLDAAMRLVAKRRIGAFRPAQDRAACRKKDLAVLARAGFSFQTAVRALGEYDGDGDEDVEY